MDRRWQPLEKDTERRVEVTLYDAHALSLGILSGELPILDLTPLVSRLEQTESELTFTLSWHDELSGARMVQPRQWVLVKLNGAPLCLQRIEALSDYRVASGVKQVSVRAHGRDAADRWREQTVATRTYALGSPTIQIVQDLARAMGLDDSEVRLTQTGGFVPRVAMQVSSVSVWAALEQVMLPGGLTPSIDALGALRGVSRDALRPSDVVLDDERVEAFSGSRARMAPSKLVLRWRAPQLKTILLPERVLGECIISAGYFKRRQVRRIKFSEDGTARATNLRLVIRESVNGLIPVADETMQSTGHDDAAETGAAVVVTTRRYVPAMLGIYVGAKLAMSFIPDLVIALFGGITVSIGRALKAGVDIAALMLLVAVGEGRYEVHGQLLDAVQEVNQTIAYDPTSSPAVQKTEFIDNDFIGNKWAAIALVAREFVYRARAAVSWSLSIVDDPRLEVGDIVALSDGTRLYITGFSRNLSHGASATLELTGFPA